MGEVAVEVRLPGQIEPDVLALPIPETTDGGLSNGGRALDEQVRSRLERLAAEGELRGELGRTLVLHTEGEHGARRVATAGIGKLEELDSDALRTASAAVARATREVGGTIAWLLDETLPLPLDEQATAVVDGILLGSYRPGRWKTDEREPPSVERIVLYARDESGLADAAVRSARVARWVNRARDLANSPPNELTPEGLAARAVELAPRNLRAEALDPKQIDELGMGALAA